MAPMVEISTELRGNFTIPSCPLIVPVGFGISLILNKALSLTLSPLGKVPVTLMVISLPVPGFMMYLPTPLALLKPGALADTLLSEIPAKEIVIGFETPRYTTFILSAEIVAEFGFGTTAYVEFTGIEIIESPSLNWNSPVISLSPTAPAGKSNTVLPACIDSVDNSTPLIITLSAFKVLSFFPKIIVPVKFSPEKKAVLLGTTIASKFVKDASTFNFPANIEDNTSDCVVLTSACNWVIFVKDATNGNPL